MLNQNSSLCVCMFVFTHRCVCAQCSHILVWSIEKEVILHVKRSSFSLPIQTRNNHSLLIWNHFSFIFCAFFFFHLTNGLLYDTLKLAAFTEIKRNREAESDSDNNIPLWFMHCFCSGRYRWFSQMCQGKNKLFILIRLVCVYAMLSLASYRMAVFMFHELSKFHSSISTHTGITYMQAFG